MPKKTADKSPRLQKPSPTSGYRLPAGAHPKNTGGKKGRSGRKPKPTIEFLRNAGENDEARRQFIAKLEEGDHKFWELVLRYTERPVSRTEHTGADGGPIQTESPVEWLTDELARIAARQEKGGAARAADAKPSS